ncbi:MAG: carbonic anhydrase [Bacteroidales bacterium]|nr:carbonic anhydrase [Bacteroidales bacterium]
MSIHKLSVEDQKTYDSIFMQNREWADDKKKHDRSFFKEHFKEQNPHFLYIGCSDSRVPIGDLTGMDIGDIFVHRNIANLVSLEDDNIMAVLQYGVDVLQIKNIVVSGHHGCGGVIAANSGKNYGKMDGWLDKIRAVRLKHAKELDGISNKEEENDLLAEYNVIAQCEQLMQIDFIRKSYEENGYPKVHAWVYDMRTGLLHDMEFDVDSYLEQAKTAK